MAIRNTREEKQFLALIARMAAPEEDRVTWMENIHANGLSEELAEEIRQKLSSSPEGESEASHAKRTRNLIDLTRIIRQWRLSRQSKNFDKH
ncbi:MAG: hypothetical protein IT308_10020 [Anaerolineaceae bacterium]|nr:hypothetical protein [Anaerolineaceae bacterium]